jgi:hypothetical protein
MNQSDDDMDIVDRIAQDLPLAVRASFYRELNYCRSLPENDELLRVLRVMQILTLLMQQMPTRVVAEREKLELALNSATAKLSGTAERAEAYQAALEKRLAALPAEVAEGLNPRSVAQEINENLRQQFVESTLPQTALAMSSLATQLRGAVLEFGKAAAMLQDSHRGAAVRAREAIAEIERSVSGAAQTARQAARELSEVFQREFRWSLYALSGLALMIGLVLGVMYQHWIDTPVDAPVRPPAAVEQAPAKIPQKHVH